MKNLSLYLTFILGMVILPNACFSKEANQGKMLDAIAAVVNDEIILFSELKERTLETARDLNARNIEIESADRLQLKVLDSLILERLQQERITQLGLKVTDEEVFEKMQEIAQKNNVSIAQLRDRLNLSAPNGFKTTRDRIRQQMLIQKLREVEVISKTQVTEGEIDNYLQRSNLQNNNTEYHLQHIMIALPEGSSPEERKKLEQKAQSVLKEIQQGADFSQMALKYSSGNKALEGGNLGWLSLDSIPTFFTDSLLDLEPGQVSKLIKSPIGYHIVKLLGVRDKDSDITTQYNLYKFVLLSENALDEANPPKALVSLSSNIQSLENFKDLNSQFSDIPSSVNENGYMGWQSIRDLPLAYVEALKSIPGPGHASKPFATELGWIILYLDNIRQTDLNKSNKRLKAMQTIRIQKANESFEIWLRRLKQEAIIDNRIIQKASTDSEAAS